MKTAQELAEEMWELQSELGESLMDDAFGAEINPRTFMTWCYGKGYINRKQFNAFVEADANKKLEAQDMNYILISDDEDVIFTVVLTDRDNDEDEKKALLILAEFVLAIDVYMERWDKFVKEECSWLYE